MSRIAPLLPSGRAQHRCLRIGADELSAPPEAVQSAATREWQSMGAAAKMGGHL
jgi:hypothetical protein